MTFETRIPEHPVDPIFLRRRSWRALTGEEIPDATLNIMFEAARWAPSAANRQPWRFVYAKRGTPNWPVFLDLLNTRNRMWVAKASAIVFVISQNGALREGKFVASKTHVLDAGAAWYSLSLQASLLGWMARAMGGIDHERVRTTLNVPDDYTVNIGIAIGRPGGGHDHLDDAYIAGEANTDRMPLKDIVMEGSFRWPSALVKPA